MRKENIQIKEKKFYDNWASRINLEHIDIDTFFEGSTSPENRFILRHLDNFQGKFILDLGCGAGENSVYFAQKGSKCIAADISSAMVNKAIELASKYGVSIKGKVVDAMSMDFPDNNFDIVYAANLLHHVDPVVALREIYRVLKPGGRVCFWDPLRHNPIINIYRRIAKDLRTENEKPLDIGILKNVRELFSNVEYDTFWIFSLWIFIKFYLFERVDPNEEPYWRKIIYEEQRLRRTYSQLERLDNSVKSLFPMLKRFAWNIAVVATK